MLSSDRRSAKADAIRLIGRYSRAQQKSLARESRGTAMSARLSAWFFLTGRNAILQVQPTWGF